MNGIKPEEIYKTVCEQTVELVFTAHPTQVCPQDSHVWRHLNSALNSTFHVVEVLLGYRHT